MTDRNEFPSPTGNPVFYRTYSHKSSDSEALLRSAVRRESWEEVCKRAVDGLAELGQLTQQEIDLIYQKALNLKAMPSGRWLWVGGRDWVKNPANFSGAYNCTSTNITDLESFGLMMDLAMQGSGTGAVLSEACISQLPEIKNQLEIKIVRNIGEKSPEYREEQTTFIQIGIDSYSLIVGDSRQGWVASYLALIKLATLDESNKGLSRSHIKHVEVDLSNVRSAGEKLKGFGGVANPIKLPQFYSRCAKILNAAMGRKLTSTDCCVLIGEAAVVVVAGNVRRSAGIRQSDSDDISFAISKDNLWQQDAQGNWRIDPDRDCLRMANHTRVFHHKPTLDEIVAAVQKQYYSGEGAIQWAGEAIARASADLLQDKRTKEIFIQAYQDGWGGAFLKQRSPSMPLEEVEHRLQRFGLNPCVTADTWIHTGDGPRRVAELIGKQHNTYVNGNLFSTTQDGFFSSGVKPVFRLTTKEGYSLRLTANHKLLKVCETSSKWVETGELKEGDRVILHNHQEIKPWVGNGNQEEGKMFGKFLGSTCVSPWNLLATDYKKLEKIAAVIKKLGIVQDGESFADQIEKTSYDFYLGFLAGLFETAAKLKELQNGESHVLLDKGELSLFQRTQRMLLRLGITSAISNRSLIIQGNEFLRLAEITNFLGSEKIATRQMIALMQKYKPLIKVGSFAATVEAIAPDGVEEVYDCTVPGISQFDANGFVAHNCGEIIGSDFHCNLSEIHLNQIDPLNLEDQREAFEAGAIAASALLHHKFTVERYQKSRELDPIVGVSFTGLFDFFVKAFGSTWLNWWERDRSQDFWIAGDTDANLKAVFCKFYSANALDYYAAKNGYCIGRIFSDLEAKYLQFWKAIVRDTVWEYCDRHGLKRPNRYTTQQPGGCLTKEALRVFDQGLLYADEHMEAGLGEADLSPMRLTVRSGVTISSGIANPELDLIKVTLRGGRQLTLTPNHRLSIQGKWVQACDLQEGMSIDFSLGEYRSARESHLEYVPIRHSHTGRQAKGCFLPSTMSPDLGYLIGAIYGNGSFSSSYRIRVCHGNVKILESLSEIGSRLFGISGILREDSRGGKHELCFANKQLYQWFVENKIHKAEKSKKLDRIPQAIRTSSRKTILGFFAGLTDTDGCIRAEGTLSIESASESFVRSLQQIGEAVGLCFSICINTKGRNLQPEGKLMFSLTLSRTLSQINAIAVLNQYSFKAKSRPIIPSAYRRFSYNPYTIAKVETGIVDFTYDYAVDGVDDDDSWYWQGALKSHNTKSLLTGASAGWHPPKAARYIRRITFAKNDPVALACLDAGYSVVPSQSDKDENGVLLDNPFDPRCTEWLVEIPVATPWADLPGCDRVDISQFSAVAQFDFYMQTQRHYTTHNGSATIELRENEINPLAQKIYHAIDKDLGYISTALLARFDDHQAYPRLPFEPIDKATYDRLVAEVAARKKLDFVEALRERDRESFLPNLEESQQGPAACDSDKCLIPEKSR